MSDLGTESPRSARSGAATAAHLPGMEGTTPTLSGLEPLMSIEELSEHLNVPVRTLYGWRLAGKGPCAVHIGRSSGTSSATSTTGFGSSARSSLGARRKGGDQPWVGRAHRSTPSVTITYVKVAGGRVRARTRYRDDDGQVRRVSATGATSKEAERNLKKVLSQRPSHIASGELTGDRSFAKLVEVWLEDLDLENKLAPSTRALYERNMRQLVMPAFEHYILREIIVRKVDQFIKTLATTKSYSMAKQARAVLATLRRAARKVRIDTRG
jgi:hypothetical protein